MPREKTVPVATDTLYHLHIAKVNCRGGLTRRADTLVLLICLPLRSFRVRALLALEMSEDGHQATAVAAGGGVLEVFAGGAGLEAAMDGWLVG